MNPHPQERKLKASHASDKWILKWMPENEARIYFIQKRLQSHLPESWDYVEADVSVHVTRTGSDVTRISWSSKSPGFDFAISSQLRANFCYFLSKLLN